MLAGFMGKLTSEAIRGLARNLFPGFYERGISANKALSELQDQGLGYRRTDFLSDFREGAGRYSQAIKVRFVNLDKVPSEGILASKYHGTPDRYSFVYQVKGTNLLTGEPDERYFFMHRNNLATRGQMEDDAMAWYDITSEECGVGAQSIRIREGYVNPAWQA